MAHTAVPDPGQLPPIVPFQDAARVLSIGRNRAYGLLHEGRFPVPVLEDGGRFKVRRTDLLRYLGYQVREAQ